MSDYQIFVGGVRKKSGLQRSEVGFGDRGPVGLISGLTLRADVAEVLASGVNRKGSGTGKPKFLPKLRAEGRDRVICKIHTIGQNTQNKIIE